MSFYFSMFGNNGSYLSGSMTDDDRTITSNDQQQQRGVPLSDLTNQIFFRGRRKDYSKYRSCVYISG